MQLNDLYNRCKVDWIFKVDVLGYSNEIEWTGKKALSNNGPMNNLQGGAEQAASMGSVDSNAFNPNTNTGNDDSRSSRGPHHVQRHPNNTAAYAGDRTLNGTLSHMPQPIHPDPSGSESQSNHLHQSQGRGMMNDENGDPNLEQTAADDAQPALDPDRL